MKKTYYFEKAFGPTGSFSGIFIFIVGLITTYFAFIGFLLVLLGAFVGFTNSATTIDFEKKQVKFTNNLFGILKVGKWLEVKDTMKIGLKRSNKIYRSHSLSNRTLDIRDQNTKIYLYDKDNQPIMPLKPILKNKDTKSELEQMCKNLDLNIL